MPKKARAIRQQQLAELTQRASAAAVEADQAVMMDGLRAPPNLNSCER